MKRTILVLLLLALATPTARAAERPNILFCLADDWGWPHAGAYGDPVVKTPAFDRLAREGVLFHHAFISSPSCTPCRNSIITGQQFYRLGHGANLWSTLDVNEPNFMFMLREAGYEIGHWRKAWGPGRFQVGGYEEHPCGPNSSFDKFMKNRDPGKPFCFWFGTSDPHRPYAKGSGRKSGMNIDRVPVPAFYPDEEPVRSDIADYYFEVQRWNRDVAEALRLLEEAGELEQTIVVMSGDHGMPFPRCKANLYDWGARVPLAIRWGKGVTEPGRQVTDFVSLTDLAPTFLAAAGLDIPEQMTGRSLLPQLHALKSGRVDEERDHVVHGRERHTPCQAESRGGYPARALRTDQYLYIRNYETERWPAGTPDWENAFIKGAWLGDCDHGPTKYYLWANRDKDDEHRRCHELCFAKRPAEELYVLKDDPDQVHNVADQPEYAKVKAELAARLTDYLRRTGDPRETAGQTRFDEFPYYGGVPKWPGQKTIDAYQQ